MISAKLTTKGQITIPKDVRDRLDLHCGDRVEFVIRDEKEAVIKPVTKSVDEVFGRLHDSSQAPRSVEEMKQAVAEKFRKRRQ